MRKSFVPAAVALVIVPSCILFARTSHKHPADPESKAAAVVDEEIAVYFSPKGGCTEAVVHALNGAHKTVDMQAYSFTSKEIAEALGNAKKRGLAVRVILDHKESDEHHAEARALLGYGVPTFTDAKHSIAHNKVIIIDGETLLTGSFNYTEQAENSNAENL